MLAKKNKGVKAIILTSNKSNIVKIEYGEKIKCNIEVTKEEKDKILKLKKEGTLKIEEYTIKQEKNIRKNIEI